MNSRQAILFAACLFATLESLAYGSPVTDANRAIVPSDHPSSAITVVSATYGRNCGQQDGNATFDLARRCDGRTACTYMLTGDIAGGGVRSCRSDLVAQWHCSDGQIHAAALSAGAAPGDQLLLTCREFPGAGK